MTIKSSIPPVATDIAEALRLHRPRTWDYWLVLCLAVIPIWSTIPICWAFSIASVYFQEWNYLSGPYVIMFRGSQLYAFAEVVFSIYHWHLVRRISKPTYTHESGELPEMQLAFHRVLQSGLLTAERGSPTSREAIVPQVDTKWNYHQADAFDELPAQDPRAIDFRNSLRPWFRHMPWSRIRQKDLRRWLCWAIFSSPLPENEADLPHADRVALDDVCELIRRRTGTVIQEGSDPDSQPLLLTLDPVNVYARPLWWYLFVFAANAITWKMLRSKYNVRYGTYQGLGYLVREPNRKADKPPTQRPRPIVLLHGLGLGLFQYSSLLNHMLDILPERPILVPLHPHISQNFFHPAFLKPLDRHRFADALAGLLQNLGWVEGPENNDRVLLSPSVEKFSMKRSSGVTMISHSNGSFVHAWMLKAYPELIHRSCFVDPVAFCLWEGDVCNNFLYRSATNGMELIMKYFVATELGVANLMQRNFDWSSNALWYEEIPHARDPARAMYFIGGEDAIINAERVKRYLESHGVRDGLRFCPGAHHGEALLPNSKEHAEIMQWLENDP